MVKCVPNIDKNQELRVNPKITRRLLLKNRQKVRSKIINYVILLLNLTFFDRNNVLVPFSSNSSILHHPLSFQISVHCPFKVIKKCTHHI